jgi:ATP-binding cassette subfamily B protein
MSEKINRLPISYFDKRGNGEVLSIITNDVDTLSQNLNQSVVQMITSVVTIIGTLIMMFSINFYMTIISIFILPISLVAAIQVVKKSEKYFKDQQDYLGHINGKVEEMFTGHNIIKVYNAEEKVINEFEKDNEVLSDAVRKSQFLSGLMKPIMDFIGNIGYVLIAIIGGYFAIIGKITVGNIQSFISYNKTFVFPIIEFAQITNMIQAMIAGSERIFEFLESDEKKKYPLKDVDTNKVKGHVVFENIHFGYNEDKIIINDFSADIKAGSKIAIVGPTGAGKTTIVKLLMRFYDLNKGKILIDGHNINSIKDADFKKIFGMVLQDTWLFSGTIMENLKYGRLDATDDEVIEMAKKVKVHHFIQTLPDGYNMMLNEDSDNISSGQKQLLTIARAVLADPKILILDEATSNVDTRTEVMLQDAMEEVMKNRTTFIIAHRLSTIKDADLILVMNNGDIVEQGNFEELMKKNGFYASIYNSQFSKLEEN